MSSGCYMIAIKMANGIRVNFLGNTEQPELVKPIERKINVKGERGKYF